LEGCTGGDSCNALSRSRPPTYTPAEGWKVEEKLIQQIAVIHVSLVLKLCKLRRQIKRGNLITSLIITTGKFGKVNKRLISKSTVLLIDSAPIHSSRNIRDIRDIREQVALGGGPQSAPQSVRPLQPRNIECVAKLARNRGLEWQSKFFEYCLCSI
jgi:hypothetical protein